MTDDTQLLLGKLLASSKSNSEKMDRVIAEMDGLRRSHNLTRDMVLRHDNGIRLGRWVIGAVIATLGALGFDRWQG